MADTRKHGRAASAGHRKVRVFLALSLAVFGQDWRRRSASTWTVKAIGPYKRPAAVEPRCVREEIRKRSRSCNHRRRPRRPVPRQVAARHPAVEWIGLAEKNPNRAGEVAPKIGADFVTGSHRELLARPEVNCAIIATDEHLHVDPILTAVERGLPHADREAAGHHARPFSAKALKGSRTPSSFALVGYTLFRRRWLAAKEKCRTSALATSRWSPRAPS